MPYILDIDNSLNFEDDVNCGKKILSDDMMVALVLAI